MRRGTLRLTLLVAAVLTAFASGCHYAPGTRVVVDPFEPQHSTPLRLFNVRWWQQLVTQTPLLEFAPREPASPAVDATSGRVIGVTRDGWIRCLKADGTPDWKFQTFARFAAGATVADGVGYVPGSDGKLYAFRMATGQKLWEYDSSEELITVPTVSDGRVYVASQNDTLFVVDLHTGKWLWQYRRDPPAGFTIRGVSTPVVRNGKVYVGFADGHLVALSAVDGTLVWDKTLSTGTQFIDVDTMPVFDDQGNLYVGAYKDGISKINAEDGTLIWTKNVPGVSTIALRRNALYAGGDEFIAAFSSKDGRELWRHVLKDCPARPAIFVSGYLVLPTTEELLFMDPRSGREVLKFDPGRGVTATPTLVGHSLYVLSNGGYLYNLTLATAG